MNMLHQDQGQADLYRPCLLVNGTGRRESITAYEARGGYQALQALARDSAPQAVIAAITAADLKGKGGANFPTGKKWAMVTESTERTRYLVCNGGEHEPGSRKDRALMEFYPHAVIEGTLLAAHTIGAAAAYIYITADQTAALGSIREALREAAARGYLDLPVQETGRPCALECFPAPSTYVAGEETAVLSALEGKEAKPRAKPPYPTVAGLHGKPTLINNVETLATVAAILNRGTAGYGASGGDGLPGGVLVTLSGAVNRPGVYEVPYGVPLDELIQDYGNGVRGGALKALLPGGPSLPFLAAEHAATPFSHAALKELGSGMGCGAIRVWSEESCMVEATLEIAEFFAHEQCGQCPMCRMETNTLALALRQLSEGKAGRNALLQIEKATDFARGKGLCSLIAMAAAPVLSAIRLFEEDFRYHIEHGRCRFR